MKAGTIYDEIEACLVRRRLHKRDDLALGADIARIANTAPWDEYSVNDLIGIAATIVAKAERIAFASAQRD